MRAATADDTKNDSIILIKVLLCLFQRRRTENVISFYLLMTCRKTLHNMLKDVISKPFRKCAIVASTSKWTKKIFMQTIMMRDNVFEWKMCLMRCSDVDLPRQNSGWWNVIISSKSVMNEAARIMLQACTFSVVYKGCLRNWKFQSHEHFLYLAKHFPIINLIIRHDVHGIRYSPFALSSANMCCRSLLKDFAWFIASTKRIHKQRRYKLCIRRCYGEW